MTMATHTTAPADIDALDEARVLARLGAVAGAYGLGCLARFDATNGKTTEVKA